MDKFKRTRNIPNINSVKKRILIPKVKNKEGEAIKTRQRIANVFAKFYEDLYEGDYTGRETEWQTEEEGKELEQHNSLKCFTINEIQDAIDRLTKGKEKDSNGNRAEQLKKLQ